MTLVEVDAVAANAVVLIKTSQDVEKDGILLTIRDYIPGSSEQFVTDTYMTPFIARLNEKGADPKELFGCEGCFFTREFWLTVKL